MNASVTARFEYPHVVAHADIDELGHAGNYHYIRWMQHAAIAHSAANGLTAERYRELGAGWVVRSHQITYLKPAFEGDALVIETWVANIRPATSLRRYRIRRSDGTLLARAETDWAFINYATQRPVRIPAEVAACFAIVDADP
jgi:acyl-CoA thioester hydrolase